MKRSLFAAIAILTASSLPALAAGDAAAGKDVAKKCLTCHSLEAGAPKKVGPNLFGVFGKPATVAELAAKGVVWDEPTLMTYLANPPAFVTEKTGGAMKSKMVLLLKDETERSNVIAYLATLK